MSIVDKIQEIPENEVVILISNYGQRELVTNCANSLIKVGIENYLIISTDSKIFQYLQDHGYNTVLSDINVSENNEDFATGKYREIVSYKFLFIYYALLSGKNITYCDNDILVFKNFYPYLEYTSDYDIAIQASGSVRSYKEIGTACTGFIHIKHNLETLNFIKKVSDECLKRNDMDQECFNYASKDNIKVHLLNPIIFPNRYHQDRQWEGFNFEGKIILHYNYFGSLGEKTNFIRCNNYIFDQTKVENLYDPETLEKESLKLL